MTSLTLKHGGSIFPPELQLNKANGSIIKVPFLGLHLPFLNGLVSSKKIMISAMILILTLNFPILDGDLPRSTSDGVFISQLIRFATVPSHVSDFNARKMLNANLFVP